MNIADNIDMSSKPGDLIRMVRLVLNGKKRANVFMSGMLAFCLAGGVGTVAAAPQGGVVVGGQGAIQQVDKTTLVNQQSQSLAIDWNSFSLAADETAQFNQPSSSATVLNRIVGQNPSEIFGRIDANGRVFLVNPNGIVFGQGSVVNVASLLASGLKMDPEGFMNGDYSLFSESADTPGVVVNRGLLQAATGGSINLVGGAVANEGLIVADLGQVNLAAGRSAVLDFDGDGLIGFAVSEEIIQNLQILESAVTNSGQISADGGQVLMQAKVAQDVFSSAVNNSGVIRASRIDRSGGEVRLVGSGAPVMSSGVIDVSGQGDSDGGTVHLLGEEVSLIGAGSIDASGPSGGGTVLIGGDYQGANAVIQNANRTYVGADTVIKANANDVGDGGKVIVWADDTTEFHGQVSARGGTDSGNGGFVEISGKKSLVLFDLPDQIDVSAFVGSDGTILLDPNAINIVTTVEADPGLPVYNNSSGSAVSIEIADIVAALGGANVILTTSDSGGAGDDISVTGTLTWAGANTLTLNADDNLDVSSGLIYSTGGGGWSYNAGGTVSINIDVTGATGVDKVYDGTTTAAISGAILRGVATGDTVSFNDSTSGTFADKNVGTGTGITTALTIQGADAGNYTLTQPVGVTADITPKALAISGSTAADKVYDGSTSATVTAGSLSGFVGTETVTVTDAGSSVFASKDAATGIDVTADYSLADGTNGGLASNYSLASETLTAAADITPKALAISGSTAADKVYDGSTSATVTAGTLTGLAAGETLVVTDAGTSTFASKDAATGVDVTADYSLANGTGLAANYTLASETLTAAADITPKALIISGSAAADKVYDGNASATVSAGSLSGFVGTETVTVTDAGSVFVSKDVAAGKDVTANYTLADGTNGGLASNYSLASETLMADISQLASVSWTGAGDATNWSDAANWAGGAIPDRANVADIDLSGATVTFTNSVPALTGSVQVNNISNGSLKISSGVLDVDVSSSLNSFTQNAGTLQGSGVLSVNNNFNQTGGTINTTAMVDITENQASNMVLGDLATTSTLNITHIGASGNIIQTGGTALNINGTTNITAAGRNVLLGNANNFSTVAVISGNDVTLQDVNALTLGASTVSGNFQLISGGALTQSGAITANGAGKVTTIAAGSGNNVTLNNAANDFASVAVTSGNDVTLQDENALALGASVISGDLRLTSGGALTQSGAITANGAGKVTTIAAGSGNNVTLNNAANDFASVTVTSGNVVALRDANSIGIGPTTVTGSMSVESGGDISAEIDGGLLKLGLLQAGGDVNIDLGGNGEVSGDNSPAASPNIKAANMIVSGTGDVGRVGDAISLDIDGVSELGVGARLVYVGDPGSIQGSGSIVDAAAVVRDASRGQSTISTQVRFIDPAIFDLSISFVDVIGTGVKMLEDEVEE